MNTYREPDPPYEYSSLVLVLVLVLIKDHLFIKRMLALRASVYPGFNLMSVVLV